MGHVRRFVIALDLGLNHLPIAECDQVAPGHASMCPLARKAVGLDAFPFHKSNQVRPRHAKKVRRLLGCEPFLVRVDDHTQPARETLDNPFKPVPDAVWQGERRAFVEKNRDRRRVTQTQAQILESRELGLGGGYWLVVHLMFYSRSRLLRWPPKRNYRNGLVTFRLHAGTAPR